MKKVIRFVMALGATACIFSLFGCGRKHIQDGPGMVNDLNWKSFTLSRSGDSFAQYNFCFTVERSDDEFLLTGECRDEDGEYAAADGIKVSAEDILYLRSLDLGNLPDIVPASPNESEELIILDAPTISLFVTDLNGVVQEKGMHKDFSMDFYNRFISYFKNSN